MAAHNLSEARWTKRVQASHIPGKISWNGQGTDPNRYYDLEAGYIKAGLIINQDDRYLLIEQVEHGKWGFPKGHIEPGDKRDSRVTACRETFEETGVNIPVSAIADQQPLIFNMSETWTPMINEDGTTTQRVRYTRPDETPGGDVLHMYVVHVGLSGIEMPKDFEIKDKAEVSAIQWFTREEIWKLTFNAPVKRWLMGQYTVKTANPEIVKDKSLPDLETAMENMTVSKPVERKSVNKAPGRQRFVRDYSQDY
jgi:8-oxo-dGTP pyrophosphatase MutT (NUDIX family)